MNCEVCGHWNRCPSCNGWVCKFCAAELPSQAQQTPEETPGVFLDGLVLGLPCQAPAVLGR